jgi:hypothetical protein
MDKQRSEREKQKYEREIEEILSKYDLETERKDKVQRPGIRMNSVRPSGYADKRRTWSLPKNWKRFSSGQYIVAAFAAAFLAVLVHNFSPLLANILALGAVVLFFLPIVLYRSSGTTTGGWTPSEQKRWRGQVIDFNTRRDITDDPFAGIKRWFKKP